MLLGPTGSGKTPLGQLIEQRGLWGHACRHFDFGANLREIVTRNQPDDQIGPQDIEFLRRVLESGALLEDEHFPLAARILRRFVALRAEDPELWIVLNGLPRHLGQAQAMEAVVDMRVVVVLDCSSQTVLERIRSNIGGDRAQRVDDSSEAVRRKLTIFAERTAGLLDYYRGRGARIERLEVGGETSSNDLWGGLAISDCHR